MLADFLLFDDDRGRCVEKITLAWRSSFQDKRRVIDLIELEKTHLRL